MIKVKLFVAPPVKIMPSLGISKEVKATLHLDLGADTQTHSIGKFPLKAHLSVV